MASSFFAQCKLRGDLLALMSMTGMCMVVDGARTEWLRCQLPAPSGLRWSALGEAMGFLPSAFSPVSLPCFSCSSLDYCRRLDVDVPFFFSNFFADVHGVFTPEELDWLLLFLFLVVLFSVSPSVFPLPACGAVR